VAKKIRGNCAYCGEYNKLSKDHVIPQCLFTDNLPGDIPKVYACTTCNNVAKSGNDTYLRDALVIDMDSSEHPIIQQLWEKFARAVQRNQSELANEIVQQKIQRIELRTPSGLFAGWVYGFKPENDRTKPLLSMMVRGLYHFYVGGTLPEIIPFDVFRIRGDLSVMETNIQMLLQLGGRYVCVGDGQVFECIYGYAVDRPEVSMWFLCFYKRAIFGVVTNHQASWRRLV
jgi:hypothetical protein